MLLVALQHLGQLHVQLRVALTGQQHPQVLHRRGAQAVIEVDQREAVITPQHVADVAVAVGTNQGAFRPALLRDQRAQCLDDALVAVALALTQPVGGQHAGAALFQNPQRRERLPLAKRALAPHRVHATDQLTQLIEVLGRFKLRRAPHHMREESEVEAFESMQRLAGLVRPRGRPGDTGLIQLGQEGVLLENLGTTPALGAIELGHPAASVIIGEVVDTILVTVQRERLAGQPEAQRFDSGHDTVRRESIEGMKTRVSLALWRGCRRPGVAIGARIQLARGAGRLRVIGGNRINRHGNSSGMDQQTAAGPCML